MINPIRALIGDTNHNADRKGQEPEQVSCPACGYYCSGKGGSGCIDKPSLVSSTNPAWPARRLVLTFTHPTAGDARFGLMAKSAYDEWMYFVAQYQFPDCDSLQCKPFTATNGVTITPSGYELDYVE